MTDINLKTLSPDTSLPKDGFLFGADSQASTNPSVYSTQAVATTLLGSTSLTGDVLTTSAPVLNLTQTWGGTSGTVFTGVKLNVTDTLSNGSSFLMDLGVGGGTFVSKFSVRKDGGFGIYESGSFNGILPSQGYVRFYQQNNFMGAFQAYVGLLVHTADSVGITFTNGVATTSGDVHLTRKNTANLRFGQADAAAPVAQTLSVQSVVAGTSSTAGADFTLTGSQNTGSGLAGNLIVSTGFSNTVGTATVTITIATPGVITWTAHGLVTGSPVVFTTTGALPTGITAGTTYFAITSSTLGVNTFQIATSAANAAAGTAITTSGTQSGVQTGTTSATVQSPLMTTTTFGPSGLTGSQTTPVLNLAQTWNTSGTVTGLKLNATDTASNAASLLLDLQVGGVSKFNVNKSGQIRAIASSLLYLFQDDTGTYSFSTDGNGGVPKLSLKAGNVQLFSGGIFGFGNGANSNGSIDTILTRKGTANLQLGAADAASATPQFLSVQSVVAGAITNPAGADFTINGSQGLGSGAGGSIIFKVAPAGTAGVSTQNALATALTIASDAKLTIASNNPVTPASGLTQIAMGDRGVVMSIYGTTFGTQPLLVSAPGGVCVNNNTGYFSLGTTADVRLIRDAANIFAQRNGASAQEFRVYENETGSIYKAILGNRQLMKISGASFTDGAGAQAGTLTNAPAVGNPTKWIPIDDNGTTRYIPAW